MDMYRNASLRLPCSVCGAEQALTRMTLAPRGGHWCWGCQLAAQIAEHAPERQVRPPSVRRQLSGVIVGAVAGVGLIVLFVGAFWFYFAFAHCC